MCDAPPLHRRVFCATHVPRCAAPGCSNRVNARGMCSTHYAHWRADMAPTCTVEGCIEPAVSRGWCSKHYDRWRHHGDPIAALLRPARGEGKPNRKGYRVVMIDGRRMPEHRHVMERVIGRPLIADENVHHKNGDRIDNDPANLELWSTMQPSGKRATDLVAYARAILDRYSDLVAEGVVT